MYKTNITPMTQSTKWWLWFMNLANIGDAVFTVTNINAGHDEANLALLQHGLFPFLITKTLPLMVCTLWLLYARRELILGINIGLLSRILTIGFSVFAVWNLAILVFFTFFFNY